MNENSEAEDGTKGIKEFKEAIMQRQRNDNAKAND